MKKRILERYERTSEGKLIIDIAANRIEDLYNDFDKRARYAKKDLDPDFADYITESVREIGEEPYLLNISLAAPAGDELITKIKGSIKSYFLYMKDLEIRKMEEMRRTSLILFVIGIVILTVSILVNQKNETWQSVIGNIFAEGLTVAAWVSLWESLATFLIQWMPHKKKIRLYERISQSEVMCESRV